ncbi:MAG TPA: hypothetical protein VGR59_12670, partial [Gemmatimonadaceae bacterium]|nr:hypothetical protein [Gemmatimonadaceae bacterium]
IDLIVEGDGCKPSSVGVAPKSTVVDVASTDEHLDEPMPAATEIGANVFATSAEIANGLLLGSRWRHRRE